MSETPEVTAEETAPAGTKPVAEHAWLHNLVGEWTITTEMSMGPSGPEMTSEGSETVTMLGGLWAFGEGEMTMPDGESMHHKLALGWDVSFNEYRGCWFASASSHLWNYFGELSEDGKVMTLSCEGPSMVKDGETANYRDVHELIDENTRTMTAWGQSEDGSWRSFMKSTYRRK
jgi:hypothetical protein